MWNVGVVACPAVLSQCDLPRTNTAAQTPTRAPRSHLLYTKPPLKALTELKQCRGLYAHQTTNNNYDNQIQQQKNYTNNNKTLRWQETSVHPQTHTHIHTVHRQLAVGLPTTWQRHDVTHPAVQEDLTYPTCQLSATLPMSWSARAWWPHLSHHEGTLCLPRRTLRWARTPLHSGDLDAWSGQDQKTDHKRMWQAIH